MDYDPWELPERKGPPLSKAAIKAVDEIIELIRKQKEDRT